MLLIFRLLFNQSVGYQEGLDTCYRWFASSYEAKSPAKLMNMLIGSFPGVIDRTLLKLLDSLDRRDDGAGRMIRNFVDIPDSTGLISAVKACSDHLAKERVGRAKSVESLFEGAVARQISKDPQCLETVGDYIENNRVHDNIARYWWQAVSSAIRQGVKTAQDYAYKKAMSGEDIEYLSVTGFRLWLCVQLLFLETGHTDKALQAWARNVLLEVKERYPKLHFCASSAKHRLESGKPNNGPTRIEVQSTTLD
jgi:hypothetical protein